MTCLPEIIKRVKTGESPPFRPELPKCAGDDSGEYSLLDKLTISCWEEMPDDRPSIEAVKHVIMKLNKGR